MKITCRLCNGTGKADNSKRITYTHRLGRPLTKGNSGELQWGVEYRKLHIDVWEQCYQVLKNDGIFILNIKDHIRKNKAQRVPEWHRGILEEIGFTLIDWYKVPVDGMKYGANADKRFDYEHVYVFSKAIPAGVPFQIKPRYPDYIFDTKVPAYHSSIPNPFQEPA